MPHWHIAYDRIARWDKFGIPEQIPVQGVVTSAWWIDPKKEAALALRKNSSK